MRVGKKQLSIMLAVCILVVGSVAAMEPPSDSAKKAMMMQSMQAAQPGPEHKILEKMAGTWDTETKMWMQPGMDPMVTNGISDSKMVLGGRFLMSHDKSGEGIHMFENITMMGYDRRYEHFTVVGFDNMGTYYVTAEGTYDDESQTISLYGENKDPIANFVQKYDIVVTFIDDDKFVSELVFKNPEMTFGQDEFKMVEVTFTRKK